MSTEQYIPKSVVVAEIERRRNQEVQWMEKQGYTEYHQGLRDSYVNILSFINTIEVKDVDLEKEWKEFLKNGDVGFKEIANHFFALGMAVSNKAQKGEEV